MQIFPKRLGIHVEAAADAIGAAEETRVDVPAARVGRGLRRARNKTATPGVIPKAAGLVCWTDSSVGCVPRPNSRRIMTLELWGAVALDAGHPNCPPVLAEGEVVVRDRDGDFLVTKLNAGVGRG